MIRKFAATKQPDAAEQAATATAAAADAVAGAAAAAASASASGEPPRAEPRRWQAEQGQGPPKSALTAGDMKGRPSYEGCSLAEVMAEKRRATAALINGDFDQQLRLAASQGDAGKVHDLVEQGARLLPDKKGRTALHYAALSGYAEVVRLLLDSGICNVDAVDGSGYSALHKAAGNGHLDIIELLIERGKAEIDLQDASNGNTALHEAAWNGYCKTVQLLLENSSNAYAANKAGCTALHLAAQNGHNQTTRTLLHAGCSPDVKNNYGDTPLHTATRYGHAGVTRILIRGKCVISEQNNNGDTSLHIAAAFRRRKIARLLMEGGIDWQLRNKQGETAIDTACRKENHEILDIIKTSVPQASSFQKHEQSAEFEYNDIMAESSETNEASLDLKAASSQPQLRGSPGATQTKATKSGLLSWLKDKLSKDKQRSLQPEQGSGGGALPPGAAAPTNWKDPKQRMQRVRCSGSAGSGSSQSGLFSQYVKQPGMAYYRDLAGNVRQGPAGYVPLYRGGGNSGVHHLGSSLVVSGGPLHNSGSYAPVQQPVHRDQPQQTWRHDRGNAEEPPEQVLHFGLRQQAAAQAGGGTFQADLATSRGFGHEPHRQASVTFLQPAPAAAVEEHRLLRDDPFAYTTGVVQHFADDYRQEQYGRYEVSARFPGRQPVLFRSRSDETLSHSEYSYHGRAFRSREAAAAELRALREREQLKESRRHRRHALAAATAAAVAADEPDARAPPGGGGGGSAAPQRAIAGLKSLPLQQTCSFDDGTGGGGCSGRQQQPALPLKSPPQAIESQAWHRSSPAVDTLDNGAGETPANRSGGGGGRDSGRRQRSRHHRRRHRSADPNDDDDGGSSSSSCSQEAPCPRSGTLPRGGTSGIAWDEKANAQVAATPSQRRRSPAGEWYPQAAARPALLAGLQGQGQGLRGHGLHGQGRQRQPNGGADTADGSQSAGIAVLPLYEPRAAAALAASSVVMGVTSPSALHPNEYINVAQQHQQHRASVATGAAERDHGRAVAVSGTLPTSQSGSGGSSGANVGAGGGVSSRAAADRSSHATGGGGSRDSSGAALPRSFQLFGIRPPSAAATNAGGSSGSNDRGGLVNGRAERTSPMRPAAAVGGGGRGSSGGTGQGVPGGRMLSPPADQQPRDRRRATAAAAAAAAASAPALTADLYGERRHAVLAELVLRSAEPPLPLPRSTEVARGGSNGAAAAATSATMAGAHRNFAGAAAAAATAGTAGHLGVAHASEAATKQMQQPSATAARAAAASRLARPDGTASASGGRGSLDATMLKRGSAAAADSLSRSTTALTRIANPHSDYGREQAVVVDRPGGGSTAAAAGPAAPCLVEAYLAAGSSGLTSPRIEGSVGSNQDSGYGSKVGEHPYEEPTASSAATVVGSSGGDGDRHCSTQLDRPLPRQDRKPTATANGSSRREPPPTYESWYSQRMSEAQSKQQQPRPAAAAAGIVAVKGQRRVISTFTTDV